MTSEAVGIDSESLLFAKMQEYKFEIPILYSADNTMTDVKSLHPYAMRSGKEWLQKWMEAKIISALTRSQ